MDDAEFRILDRLLFPEPFEHLPEETGLPAHLVAAVLRQLLHQRMIRAYTWNDERQTWEPATLYSGASTMAPYAFQMTHTGLRAYEKHREEG